MISLRIFLLFLPLMVMACNNDVTNSQNPSENPVNPIDTIKKIKYLALGDSYTIGQSVEINERFPVQLIDSLRRRGYKCENTQIIARTGWRTDDLMTAINTQNITDTFDLVSLLIGVNNQYQGKPISVYRTEFRQLLERAIAFAGGDVDKVFVLSIPDYSVTPFGSSNAQQISSEIDAFNAVNLEITDSLKVQYFDITPISRMAANDPALLANDQLHPSGKMYRLWVSLMLNVVEAKLD
jgi:lysophospholipase L1-like esterase